MAAMRRILAWTAELTEKFAWPLFLVCLPVTSFPYFPKTFGGSALVRPLSIYPLVVLLVVIVLPRLVKKPAPRTLLALLPFALVAVASALLSTLRGIEPTFGVTVNDRILRTLVTLAIGGAFYVTTALVPLSTGQLRNSLRWLYVGCAVALVWGSLQAVYVIDFNSRYYKLLASIQEYISTRDLFSTRVSGLTYEPNWFAMQISQMYMPWLLGSMLSGVSAFRWRLKWITFEWMLFAWSVAVLAFTYSRAGLGILIMLVFLALLFFRPHRSTQPRALKKTRPWLRRLMEAGLGVLVIGGLIYVASLRNPFFSRLWDYWNTKENASLENYIEYVGFRARFTYSEAALNVYSESPWMGVGLGNYAFYFPQMMPDRPLATSPELLRIILPDDSRDRLITPKNFFLRILAETGLVGTAAFSAFLVAVLGSALFLWTAKQPDAHYWGIASLLSLAAFIAATFSFDSFAIPNSWIGFGLTTAAAWLFSREPHIYP